MNFEVSIFKAILLKNTIPKFGEVLLPIMYRRHDDEPVKMLGNIYPFSKIDNENQYDYEGILLHCSTEGIRYIIPYLIEYFLESQENLSSNLFDSFEQMPSVTIPYEKDLEKFIESLTVEERHAFIEGLDNIEQNLKHVRYSVDGITQWKNLM